MLGGQAHSAYSIIFVRLNTQNDINTSGNKPADFLQTQSGPLAPRTQSALGTHQRVLQKGSGVCTSGVGIS